MVKKPQKSAGRKAESGNVTVIDFGEKHHAKIERMVNEKLSAAGVNWKAEMSGKGESVKSGPPASIGSSRFGRPFMGRPGNVLSGYRPGGFRNRFGERPAIGSRLGARTGGRPWFSRSGGRLGQESATVPSGRTYLIPASVQSVKTGELLVGGALGTVGNRALVRFTPMLWKTVSPLANDGLAFVAGLIPLVFKRNAYTVGVAIPGAVILGSRLLDMLFNWIAPGAPAIGNQGNAMHGGQDATWAARQKLAQIQNRINQPQQAPRPLPRVVAQPQHA